MLSFVNTAAYHSPTNLAKQRIVLLSLHALVQTHSHALAGYVKEINYKPRWGIVDATSFKLRTKHGNKLLQNANTDAWLEFINMLTVRKTDKLNVC